MLLRDSTRASVASTSGRLTSAELRRELSVRNLRLAEGVPHESTYSAIPSVLYQELNREHGNFLPASYRRICASPEWSRRLKKCYTSSKKLARSADRTRKELDCANSSDALLMNIFCHPSVLRDGRVSELLGAEPGISPCFGYKARVPVANGRFDRTEVDLLLGDLLVEAKLTENDFQTAEEAVLLAYRDFSDVFDRPQLPQTDNHYLSYQLLRNVLAAYALHSSFCVLVDARRPDLADAWYAVMKCVKPVELRTKLRISTWQEVAQATPSTLRAFLAAKYGIGRG